MDGAGEILKSGAMANLTDLLKRLPGPAFEEFGAILADNVRVYRLKNILRTAEKTKRILEDAGLEANPVPSRLLIPILDTCSVEDDDDLQERWAALLASASQAAESLSPSFIEVLKQLTPQEAKHLDYISLKLHEIYKRTLKHYDSVPYQVFTKAWNAPSGAGETYERLGLIQRNYDVKLDSGSRSLLSNPEYEKSTISDIESAIDELQAEIQFAYEFTDFGLRFIEVCRGPSKKETRVKD